MPTLTAAETRKIQAALARRRTQLLEEMRDELERAGRERFAGVVSEVLDSGDASVADMLRSQDVAIVRRLVEELAQVEAAQRRLPNGDFGVCEECGAAIGLQRLLAVPHATRCIACQTQHEKMDAHETTPKP